MKLHGLEILIERMQSHPEEFTKGGKWTELLVAVDRHLTDEERQALKQGFADMSRGMFNEVVLKGIAGEHTGYDIYDMVEIIQQDYDSVMTYPLERQKALEREKKEQYQRQIEMEKLNLDRQRAMQGMGGLGARNMYGTGWNGGL
jgi:hypothetical protein